MEQLQYVIEDSTIAELLGVQNFTNDESAVLELVKNSYDAKATAVTLTFSDNTLTVTDTGEGMNASDIKRNWMHVGKSPKEYEVIDRDGQKRILAGAKGIGRFALARLGRRIEIQSQKEGFPGVMWMTDWNTSTLSEIPLSEVHGTKIVISDLREKWNKKKVEKLKDFLSKTYNATEMQIIISHPDMSCVVPRYFQNPELGRDYLSRINIQFESESQILFTSVFSDEFAEEAKAYCVGVDITQFQTRNNMVDELKASADWDLSDMELKTHLASLGDFSGEFYFSVKPTKVEADKFLYKRFSFVDGLPGGIILYRNAFSIAAYEGKKDWLGLGKRSRKSPAAASHPTGSWRVRENQIAGKVEIDKKRNAVLQDLSNRQGLDENIYYELFVEIILTGIKEFERYRQGIIRKIDVKNSQTVEKSTPISDRVIANPRDISTLSTEEAKQLASEIKSYRNENSEVRREKEDVENRYKYDVRILNVLATVGLKAASIAHEMKNDRNSIADNTDNIIAALQEYGFWDDLNSPEMTAKAYKNVPKLLESNKTVSAKIVAFMNVMLSEIEKRQFKSVWQSVLDILLRIKERWEDDYAWLVIEITNQEDICCNISEDVLQVIFDNLILNSVQQNENRNHLRITISADLSEGCLAFVYSDDGKGLDPKYQNDPKRILAVHETTRKNGHGLGMWIVNNTVVMSGGQIDDINGQDGFSMEFTIGGVE